MLSGMVCIQSILRGCFGSLVVRTLDTISLRSYLGCVIHVLVVQEIEQITPQARRS